MPFWLIVGVIHVLRIQENLGIYEMIRILKVIDKVAPRQWLTVMKLS